MAFHDHCPICHADSLRRVYPTPPDYTEEEKAAGVPEEDYENAEPIGVGCDNCGYEAE